MQSDKIFCPRCGQELATIKPDGEMELTAKAEMVMLGITIDGNISGGIYCHNCGYTRTYQVALPLHMKWGRGYQ